MNGLDLTLPFHTDDYRHPIAAGVTSAIVLVAAYVAALLYGFFLAALSSGCLDVYGLSSGLESLIFKKALGLKTLRGLICAWAGLCGTICYFRLRRHSWELLAILSLLSLLYFDSGFAGARGLSVSTILSPPPEVSPVRLFVAIACIVWPYVVGKTTWLVWQSCSWDAD